jgi:hypothetical protein
MIRRSRGALAAVGGASIVVGCAVLVAAPAVAATLPDGQNITTIDTAGTAFEADPTTAVLTAIGPTGVTQVFATDVDQTGHGYAIVVPTTAGVPSVLYDFDATTGATTDPHPITVAGHGDGLACQGIDYTGGVIVASCSYEPPDGGQFGVIGVLDPVTGVLSADVLTNSQDPITAVAKSPTDGTIWVITFSNVIAKADLAAHTFDPFHPLQQQDVISMNGADFDRDGQLYVTYEIWVDGTFTWQLGVLDTDAATIAEVGTLAPNVDTEAITVWGVRPLGGEDPAGPALPATGSDVGPGLLVGALALLGLGGAALFTVRLKEVRHEPSYS